jgi:CDP-glycerol glycerophosphotransferase (TagB/SpsB family)
VIRCGYGRFAMALSQACQELNISSIELQHGLITSYHPAYVKTTSSKNLDCIPKYLLTQGDIFTKIVQQGKIFKESNIITIGYPYLEIKQKEIEGGGVQHKDNLRSPPATILFTSQWILAQKSKAFISEVAQQFIESKMNVRIIFKPHPYDTTDYSSLAKFDNITLADKYEDTFDLFNKADIHSTVYSTSGLEAMSFGKPNIFIDIYELLEIKNNYFIVSTPKQFVTRAGEILSNYKTASDQAREISKNFFKPFASRNLKNLFTKLEII